MSTKILPKNISPDDITIRSTLQPGDLGYVIHRHGKLYGEEQGFGISFEIYVSAGLHEFYRNYDPVLDRVWIAEHEGKIVGFLLLMHREHHAAQLRYFYLEPGYRGLGLGKRLMAGYMDFLVSRGYKSSYLLTTDEQRAAASLYIRNGFKLSEETESTAFGKPLKEQRYDLVLVQDKI